MPRGLDALVPAELEKELLAGVFRTSYILEERPDDEFALAAMRAVEALDPNAFGMSEHRQVHQAIQEIFTETGCASPSLVKDRLRLHRAFGAMRALPDIVSGPWAAVRSMALLAEKIRVAARARSRFERARDVQARILAGDAS